MGVFKEEASTFEAINFQQVRIYKGAADCGVAYNTNDVPGEVQAVFDTLDSLRKLDIEFAKFPTEKRLIRNRQTWGEGNCAGVSVDVIIFWETDNGMNYGTMYTISFNKLSPQGLIMKDANAMISVDIEKFSEKA
jgi:hypothetical protein